MLISGCFKDAIIAKSIILSASEWKALRDLLEGAGSHPHLVTKIDAMLRIYEEHYDPTRLR
mgnify:CR=1 FL=1